MAAAQAQTIYQALIDAELTAVVGASPWERTDQRVAQRNGSRFRTLTTTAGDLELRIRSCGRGRSFPRCSNAVGGSIRFSVARGFPSSSVSLDTTYRKARVNRGGGVPGGGVRHRRDCLRAPEVLGFDVGDSEDGAFWTAFLGR